MTSYGQRDFLYFCVGTVTVGRGRGKKHNPCYEVLQHMGKKVTHIYIVDATTGNKHTLWYQDKVH